MSLALPTDPEALLRLAQAQLDRLSPDCPDNSTALETLATCVLHLQNTPQAIGLADSLLSTAETLRSPRQLTAPLDHLAAQLAPHLPILFRILYRLQHGSNEERIESIQWAERCLAQAESLTDQIAATDALLSSWIFNGGSWQRAIVLYQSYKALLQQLVQSVPPAENHALASLAPVGMLFFYFEDNPRLNRPLRNQIATIAQTHLQATLPDRVRRYNVHTPCQLHPLPRIGYFAGSLRQHSVGWLCRWLLKYHDRTRFDIHLYSSRPSQDWIQSQLRQEYGDRFHDVSSTISNIADRIYDDQIDILVELDSLTSFGGCGVVGLKPAPIQVHWLGYDASGMPAVDYFIADPYVLPDDAQAYYHEKIWRLPQTYIAVDGFELHTPSLRRDQLNLPSEAIVFLSSQTGMKRNVENARLQLQILKAVPNSYFLVKSFKANPSFIETFFRDLAESEGVSGDRLRFLPDVASEFVHRANLALADVVLDTYPYNGATTTLEALWMGLPIVTRVGEQFAARNSYTMMRNVGLTEGIAWSDPEYLEWGIRLGTDAALRQDIYGRLKRSRHTSPLWNGRAFAKSMEQAYEQMWQIFQS